MTALSDYNMASARIQVLLSHDYAIGSPQDLEIMKLGRMMEDFQRDNMKVELGVTVDEPILIVR